MLTFFIKLEPCLIGMETCSEAHCWAGKLSEIGHTVKWMAPQFVKPYVKTNKTDVTDAEAICGSVTRPTAAMRLHAGAVDDVIEARYGQDAAIILGLQPQIGRAFSSR